MKSQEVTTAYIIEMSRLQSLNIISTCIQSTRVHVKYVSIVTADTSGGSSSSSSDTVTSVMHGS